MADLVARGAVAYVMGHRNEAVQSNKVSGVTQRYKAQSGLSKSCEPTFDSPGKTISKYGAKFDLQNYIPISPTSLINFISIHLASY